MEVFDRPAKWEVIEDNDYGYIVKFTIGNETYEFVAEQEDEDMYMIDFFLMSNKNPTTKITNTGNSLQVFATVVNIFRKFITLKKPSVIEFSAKESSRVKLYDRMAQLLNKAGFSSVDAPPSSDGKSYKFVKG